MNTSDPFWGVTLTHTKLDTQHKISRGEDQELERNKRKRLKPAQPWSQCPGLGRPAADGYRTMVPGRGGEWGLAEQSTAGTPQTINCGYGDTALSTPSKSHLVGPSRTLGTGMKAKNLEDLTDMPQSPEKRKELWPTDQRGSWRKRNSLRGKAEVTFRIICMLKVMRHRLGTCNVSLEKLRVSMSSHSLEPSDLVCCAKDSVLPPTTENNINTYPPPCLHESVSGPIVVQL